MKPEDKTRMDAFFEQVSFSEEPDWKGSAEAAADPEDEEQPAAPSAPAARKTVEAVTFGNDAWRAVVRGVLQRPTFNARGPAMIFAQQVAMGLRPADPVG